VGAASIREAVIVGDNVLLTFGKETGITKASTGILVIWKKFERLSNEVLIRTCPCGIVFKTYELKKECTIQTVVGQVTLEKDMEP
jgi:hypothetical protein